MIETLKLLTCFLVGFELIAYQGGVNCEGNISAPPQEEMVEVMVDGMPWLLRKNETGTVHNSSTPKAQEEPMVPDANPEYNLTAEIQGGKLNGYIRVFTSDGYCVESDPPKREVHEAICENKTQQKFILRMIPDVAKTYVISGVDGGCPGINGTYFRCDTRRKDQYVELDKLNRIFMRNEASKALDCPTSLGINRKAFIMTSCNTADPDYFYAGQKWDEPIPKAKSLRFINKDGFCLNIFTNWAGFQKCSAAEDSKQMLRKVAQPGGAFMIQSAFGMCLREEDVGGDMVKAFTPTEDCATQGAKFTHHPVLKKLVSSSSSNCVTGYCVEADCNPREKRIVSRACEERIQDQIVTIQGYNKSFTGFEVDWFVVKTTRQTDDGTQTYAVTRNAQLVSYSTTTPWAWFSASELSNLGNSEFIRVKLMTTTSVPQNLECRKYHTAVENMKGLPGYLTDCGQSGTEASCSVWGNDISTNSVKSEVYK